MNEKKTANAETGMMGFYRNLLTKNKAVGGGIREDPSIQAKTEEVGEKAT